jgi:hypothetical protein
MKNGKEQSMQLTIVVSGQATTTHVDRRNKLQTLVERVLKQTGNVGQAPDQWELRDADGQLLEATVTAAAYKLVDGCTLYLNPRAGWGAVGDWNWESMYNVVKASSDRIVAQANARPTTRG